MLEKQTYLSRLTFVFNPDGTERIAEMSHTVIIIEDGVVLSSQEQTPILGIAPLELDITDRKALDTALGEASAAMALTVEKQRAELEAARADLEAERQAHGVTKAQAEVVLAAKDANIQALLAVRQAVQEALTGKGG